ncbi:MAG: hypothetical protein N0E59_02260 [Candidatus Thiodiazotropha taylori]|nr:hypothetical protein [Candidatus Thiodiazotropha taylori]MCG8051925.1 hypothetical protein [Candidatus Thiodiazotropha taylori]MCG8109563.1 hypothetical protein [Candidatus Thiodiazotropha taylori]MCW4281907.1 hypothetical protein [Candidatus Thiodiazotropha taylori]MCW4306093.1 hypothetical protein [Candidatus Thiodiazotropha taylori]
MDDIPKQMDTRHNPLNFGTCYAVMEPGFLNALDQFIEQSPGQWILSPAPGTACRFHGSKTSQHYAKGRRSNAADIMLKAGDIDAEYARAKETFCGTGLYKHWKPYPGLHVDTRQPVKGQCLTWEKTRNGAVVYKWIQTSSEASYSSF